VNQVKQSINLGQTILKKIAIILKSIKGIIRLKKKTCLKREIENKVGNTQEQSKLHIEYKHYNLF